MSGNNYTYNYPPPPPPTTYYPQQEKSWSWSNGQQYNSGFNRTGSYNSPSLNPVYNTNSNASHETPHVSHSTHVNSMVPPPGHSPYSPGVTIPPQSYYSYNKPPAIRPYRQQQQQQQRRFNNVHQYPPNLQHGNWNRNVGFKRPLRQSEGLSEQKAKGSKKKKKPLSQNIPSKKDWTIEEAEKAFTCEKEYNKRHKNQSLIIKFPDLELNKDIVSKFHSAIENVHFQQPSTARFCFVSLDDSADADTVISEINKIKFGEGFLTAEYKKDREDEQNIGPEDIDPHTLYVGNLAQDITKEDMTKTYPKSKRIDIGYAKKMKYTRYAFVNFKSVDDCVEAFKKTHNTQLYSKSLIVRFRRLHGTVGMPGESKPQNHQKNTDDELNSSNHINDRMDYDSNNESVSTEPFEISSPSTLNDHDEVEKRSEEEVIEPNLDLVKKEPRWEEEIEKSKNRRKVADEVKLIRDEFLIPHRPKIKVEIKEEPRDEPPEYDGDVSVIRPQISIVKKEPESKSDDEDMFSFGGSTSTRCEESDTSDNEDEDNYMLGMGNDPIFSRYVAQDNIQS